MRLLFLRTYRCLEKFYFPGALHEPLSILTLTSFLKPFCEVKVIDAAAEGWNSYWEKEGNPELLNKGLKPKDFLKAIGAFKPDVIGITWLFPSDNDCINDTAKYLKEHLPGVKLIVGGPEPSAKPKEILEKNPEIDMVIFGEGEMTLKELVLQNFKNLDGILGIAYRSANEIKVNLPRPRIQDLGILPIPDHGFLNSVAYSRPYIYALVFKYFKKLKLPLKINCFLAYNLAKLPVHKLYFWVFNQKPDREELLPKADIITSRGCPNQCTFCSIHNVWGHRWIAVPIDNILKEIDILVNKYKIRHINIQDDNFNLSKERTVELCKKIIERKYKITLCASSGVYVPSLDEEVLTWLKRAGMNLMRFSIESGSQRVLNDVVKKRIDLKTVKPIVNICKKLKIKTEGAFIFGIPGQTIAEMEENIRFAEDCGFDEILKFIYHPFPNTELYRICEEKGYLTENFDPRRLYVNKGSQCYVKTEDFSPEDVLRIARRL